jgi:hypothetical protein
MHYTKIKANIYLLPVAIALALTSFLLPGCKKNQDIDSENKTVQDFLVLPEESQKLAYGLLDQDEKVSAWKTHIRGFMLTEDLTKEQKLICTELLDFISPLLFDPAQPIPHQAVILATFRIKAISSFGRLKAQFLIASLQNSYEQFSEVYSIMNGNEFIGNHENDYSGIDKCNCSTGSDWCWFGSSCTTNNPCKQVENSCGTFWTSTCDGKCQ